MHGSGSRKSRIFAAFPIRFCDISCVACNWLQAHISTKHLTNKAHSWSLKLASVTANACVLHTKMKPKFIKMSVIILSYKV